MLFWTPYFSVLDSTFFVLDSTFWLDSTLKIDPLCANFNVPRPGMRTTESLPLVTAALSGLVVCRCHGNLHVSSLHHCCACVYKSANISVFHTHVLTNRHSILLTSLWSLGLVRLHIYV